MPLSLFDATFMVDSSSGATEGLALIETWTEVLLVRFTAGVGVGTGVDFDLLVVLDAAMV